MRFFVGGSLMDVPRDQELASDFVCALGQEIVEQGHILLNGCRSSLDREIARAAHEWLTTNAGCPEDRIISYCLKGDERIHDFGKVCYSALTDWQMNHPELRVPEQIEKADATIFVAGSEGTFWAKNWACYARKPILGIPRFGGAGETIYDHELRLFQSNPSALGEDYETLNQLSTNMSSYAKEVIALAERMVVPRYVFTIMSFKKEFRDVYASYQHVCNDFGFKADRTDEQTSFERIIPRIEMGIRKSAFIIADVTGLSPNVLYEVGFARGLGKDVIMTAKKGTELPFDIDDIPTVFWETKKDLKEGLRKYVKGLAGKFGRCR